jgi:hypothetical protein
LGCKPQKFLLNIKEEKAMQIMSQDRRRLVNSEAVSQFYIEPANTTTELYAVADGRDVLLGDYDKTEHAESALKFIGVCMVDEDTKGKITQVPSRKDMTLKDKLLGSAGAPKDFAELMEKVLSVGPGGGDTENPDTLFRAIVENIF